MDPMQPLEFAVSAEIIEFPKSRKQLEIEAMNDYVDNAKRVSINNTHRYDVPNIAGVPVNLPKTGKEFLELCKQFLEPEDYMDILCGVLDKEHYDALETHLQKIINSYYSFQK